MKKKLKLDKKKLFPVSIPHISQKDIYSVINCLPSTFISSAGKKVYEFENQLKKITTILTLIAKKLLF